MEKNTLKKKIFTALLVLSMVAFSCKNENRNTLEDTRTNKVNLSVTDSLNKTLMDITLAEEDFSVLENALSQTGLVNTLDKTGPYTVFAPTNEAFENLETDSIENLINTNNTKQLSNILTYHVILGKYNTKKIKRSINRNDGLYTLLTIQGDSIKTMLKSDKIVLIDALGNQAKVIGEDIKASNGILHAIDAIVLPAG